MKKYFLLLGIAGLFISCDNIPPSSDDYVEEYDPIFNAGEYDPKTESIILHYNKEVIPVIPQKLSDEEYEEENFSSHWFDFTNPVKQTDNFFEEFLN